MLTSCAQQRPAAQQHPAASTMAALCSSTSFARGSCLRSSVAPAFQPAVLPSRVPLQRRLVVSNAAKVTGKIKLALQAGKVRG